jgi:hypothetical protein
MKAQEMSAALVAFAPLAEARRTQELQSFATIFKDGEIETVTQRLNKIPPGIGLPASVKASLAAIEAGLLAVGANKQAADVKAVLSKFSGSSDGAIHELVAQVKTAMLNRPVKGGAKKAVPSPDQVLAKELVDELTRALLDKHAFSSIVQRLSDEKQISTPTLHVIGNGFLGNNKVYKGRKPVITDIEKRQSNEMLDSSRRAANKRAG